MFFPLNPAEKSCKEPATLFREPKLELPLLVQFLPAMMSLIVDDQVRYLYSTGTYGTDT
jgi:hypothetical protein